MATPIDGVVLKCRKICPTGNCAKPCVIYLTKNNKISAPHQRRYCSDRVQNLPRPAWTFGSQCSRFHTNRFTFGGVIADCMKAVLWAHWVNPRFARSEASLRAIISWQFKVIQSQVLNRLAPGGL